jgi:ADP-heptose:LPS heptosyltransferase
VAPHSIIRGEGCDAPHEVEKVFAVARRAFDIPGPPPPCWIVSDARETERARSTLPESLRGRPLVGLHISARKPSQRWPAERFAALARRLHTQWNAGLLLFWSPGPADHPQHPGDDEKAAAIVAACAGLPLQPMPSQRLDELVTGLSLADSVVCADGGAMHVAAGLGKPIVCLFGDSDASRWHPWGVPYELIQPSRNVADISADMAFAACERLLRKAAA